MRALFVPLLTTLIFLAARPEGLAQVTVTVARRPTDEAAGDFKFSGVGSPVRNDAATKATFKLVDGQSDGNGGGLDKLHDGALPIEADDPAHNFFFRDGDGGRLLIDLGSAAKIAEVNTYSWHPGSRGPQVYRLYVSDGESPGFEREPMRPGDPTMTGWKLIASVDTRPDSGEPGGQYGVALTGGAAEWGAVRYLLFDIEPTLPGDSNSNTFFSEINVRAREQAVPLEPARPAMQDFSFAGGRYHCYLDVTAAPELADWAEKELLPVVQAWYPKIVDLLPSEGFTAPRRFSITFKEMDGVAYTANTDIFGSRKWYGGNLHGEGLGSIVHELVHVVQQYRGRTRPPIWLIEGIPEYIRWYLFEPQSHGADIRTGDAGTARYDAPYRQNGNFLHWVIQKYPPDLLPKLNATLRAGRYRDEWWREETGHSIEELAQEWQQALAQP